MLVEPLVKEPQGEFFCKTVIDLACPKWSSQEELTLLSRLECLVESEERIGEICTSLAITQAYKDHYVDACSNSLSVAETPKDIHDVVDLLETQFNNAENPKVCAVNAGVILGHHHRCSKRSRHHHHHDYPHPDHDHSHHHHDYPHHHSEHHCGHHHHSDHHHDHPYPPPDSYPHGHHHHHRYPGCDCERHHHHGHGHHGAADFSRDSDDDDDNFDDADGEYYTEYDAGRQGGMLGSVSSWATGGYSNAPCRMPWEIESNLPLCSPDQRFRNRRRCTGKKIAIGVAAVVLFALGFMKYRRYRAKRKVDSVSLTQPMLGTEYTKVQTDAPEKNAAV